LFFWQVFLARLGKIKPEPRGFLLVCFLTFPFFDMENLKRYTTDELLAMGYEAWELTDYFIEEEDDQWIRISEVRDLVVYDTIDDFLK
jgi:hypothetical protein